VLRYSVDRSTAELLYLPLPAGVKLQVKWFIDTVIWRLGDGLSGVIVLIFATWLRFSPRQISWVVLAAGQRLARGRLRGPATIRRYLAGKH